jgi:hypothetical protein
MDLKPETEIPVIPSGLAGESFFFELTGLAILSVVRGLLVEQRLDQRLELRA